jgi:hypothetical protein
MTTRSLTAAEMRLAQSVFGTAIQYDRVRLHNAKWIFFQPPSTVMSPDGDIWFHPKGCLFRDDFCSCHPDEQGLFIHEMTHVWQHQKGIYLPLKRHPFCRYSYTIKPGQKFERYGLEQQAELVRHAFLLREGREIPGAPGLDQYRSILPFRPNPV